METSDLINNFTSGELTPRLDGRVDLDRYATGCRTLQNMIVHPHGGASRRYGTRYVAAVKGLTKFTRLIEFEFSIEQAYVIETGDLYMRFYKDSGVIVGQDLVTNGTFPSGITDWDDLSTGTGSIAHDAVNQDMEISGGAAGVGWAEQDIAIATIYRGYPHTVTFEVKGNAVAMQIGSATGTANILAEAEYAVGIHTVRFTPGSGVATIYLQFKNSNNDTRTIDNVELYANQYEIATPYLEADLSAIKFAQTADTMYLVHESYKPRKLTRTDHNAWTLTECDFWDGPYLDEDASGTTITPSGTTGSITLTASASLFTSADIGRIMAIKHTTAYGWGVITAVASPTSATMTVKEDLDGSGTAAAAWKWGAWGGEQGWPRAVTFYEQRLIIGSTPEKPQTVWGSSNVGATDYGYEHFKIGTNDDDSFEYTFAADQVNSIRWLKAARYLFAGSHGGEWVMSSGSDDLAITPSQVKVRRETTHGSNIVQAIQIGHAILFITRSGRKVRQISYNLSNDSFEAEEISILAQHLMRYSGIIDWAHQEEPDSILWCIREDGALLGFTYERQHKVFAWHYHDTDEGNDLFESVACIPETDHDQVWFVVKRYINGSWTRYVEFLEKDFGLYQNNAFYVDSGLTYYDPSTITGITKADPGVVTSAGHGYSAGDKIKITGVVGMTELNGNYYYVGSPTYSTFELKDKDGNNIDTSGYGAYVSGGLIEKVVSALSGLSHLEGETVAVLADGAIQPSKTVSSGSITLDRECIKAQVGLPFKSILEPMRLESKVLGTTAQGRTKRIHQTVIRFFETIACKIGRDENTLEDIHFRKTTDPMGSPVIPYTGDKVITFPGNYDMDAYIRIESSYPTPMSVLAIIAKINIYGD